jgi:hypothetical protein
MRRLRAWVARLLARLRRPRVPREPGVAVDAWAAAHRRLRLASERLVLEELARRRP